MYFGGFFFCANIVWDPIKVSVGATAGGNWLIMSHHHRYVYITTNRKHLHMCCIQCLANNNTMWIAMMCM
jgi:hypothetical protein